MFDNATPPLNVLLWTASTVALFHTAMGLDHSLPFVVLARARRWSLIRLWRTTLLCGAVHLLASTAVAGLGIAAGYQIQALAGFDVLRSTVAGRLWIVFGIGYATISVVRIRRSRPHTHVHVHEDGVVHAHLHQHHSAHAHTHASEGLALSALPLVAVFAIGPCEPLVPLLLAPSLAGRWMETGLTFMSFAFATLATMLLLVTLGYLGLRLRRFALLDRYAHAIAGCALAASGVLMEWFGL